LRSCATSVRSRCMRRRGSRFAVLENLGYRQLLHLWRLEGFWQLARRSKWEAMTRRDTSPTELIA
jgi:hypothetical protein